MDLKPFSDKMDQVIELTAEEINNLSVGRAKPAVVESIQVEAYEGSTMEVRELANISAPDPQSILIQPWDKEVIEPIVKAISESDLKLNPVVDGQMIRINVPPLTAERREEIVRSLKQKIESGRSMIRQVRIEARKQIDDQKDESGISEDDIRNLQSELQETVDEYNKKLTDMETTKEQELTKV